MTKEKKLRKLRKKGDHELLANTDKVDKKTKLKDYLNPKTNCEEDINKHNVKLIKRSNVAGLNNQGLPNIIENNQADQKKINTSATTRLKLEKKRIFKRN